MNGTTKGFFPGGRGIRQGNPLSPYMFIIQQEILTRMIHCSVAEHRFGQFQQGRGTSIIYHLMYADDVVIFSNGSQRSVRELLSILGQYERWSGQAINKHKSAMFCSNKIFHSRKRRLLRTTSFVEGHFALKYLGVPIILGRLKQIPQVVINKIHQMMSSFFWGELNGKDKKKWVAWKHMGMPVAEGGIGVRLLHEVQTVLHMSYKWRVKEGDIYFWYDKWWDNGPLINELPLVGQPLMKIKECRLSDGWDVNLLENLVGLENVDDILVSLSGPNSGKDVLV
ncbi:uncharacterized protein LOC122311447 [Carya illinoinensis]|uniref:uncharacterized protein LOC122311447 n=1 Tax=Carya illinoinensis TaxID=32201 RepID=UPI001C71C3CC|nr:uncharacterized protein LOC122311447 [Carya illinoinensis]